MYLRDYSPFFDQEDPEIPITGEVERVDYSQPYELDALAVFECERGFLVVHVSGCSCWPDRGGTTQAICEDRFAVQQELRDYGQPGTQLLDACTLAGWRAA